MKFEILKSGSKGNAVLINSTVLIDCGVSFKLLADYVAGLQLVLLTHIHGDHFNKTTIRRLAKERPMLRFGCGPWLVSALLELDVMPHNIDMYDKHLFYGYGPFKVMPVPLYHDVLNYGYKVHIGEEKLIYATDTNKIETEAKNYDLYLIEANHETDLINEKIALKRGSNEFSYEERAKRNHLSLEKANDFIFSNAGPNSKYVYMHVSDNYEVKT